MQRGGRVKITLISRYPPAIHPLSTRYPKGYSPDEDMYF